MERLTSGLSIFDRIFSLKDSKLMQEFTSAGVTLPVKFSDSGEGHINSEEKSSGTSTLQINIRNEIFRISRYNNFYVAEWLLLYRKYWYTYFYK